MPVEMLSPLAVRSKKFMLMTKQQVTPSGAGYIQTIDRASPFWYAEYETAPLDPVKHGLFIAWLDELEGSMNTFLGFDPRRPVPYALRSQGLGTTGWHRSGSAPRVTGVSFSNSTVDLDTMATGAVVTIGDLFSIFDGTAYRLHRATAAAVANGSGQITGLKVKPRPVFSAATPRTVRYVKPVAEMKMIGSFEEDDSVDSFPVLKFRGIQFVNKSV